MEFETDLSRFLETYQRMGVQLVPVSRKDEEYYYTVDIKKGCPKTDGYEGLYMRLVFDGEGKFKEQGIWE